MSKGTRKAPTDPSADPDKLVRQEAGTYRTPDERFEVREADVGWFLVDSHQTNEFGQELIQGPFSTLKAVREALPGARASKPAAARRRPAPKKATKPEPKPKAPPPPPPSWIERLSKAEAAAVRTLIGALEADGIDDAEALVQRDREGLMPAVAARLIERRLEALVEDLPAKEQQAGRALLRRAVEVLTAQGTTLRDPLPGWTLVEVGPEPEPSNRRIDLRR
jgi:hypothetical protein